MERLLVVDDDPHIGQLLKNTLTQKGFEVKLCDSALSVMDEAKKYRPELIILDVMLGDGIGYEIARRIRRDPTLYRCAILFQSVIGESFDVQHALRQGGDAYLRKPYNLDNLTKQIEHLDKLIHAIESPCPVTKMPRMEALRREVDHRLFRQEEFALCLVFMKGLSVFRKEQGLRAEQRITDITAQTIRSVIRDCGIYETFTAHIGGGYFMVIVGIQDYRRFRDAVKAEFRNRTNELRAIGICDPPIKASSQSSAARRSLLKLLVGVTHTNREHFMYADEMLDKLRKAEDITQRNEPRYQHALKKGKGHDHWI